MELEDDALRVAMGIDDESENPSAILLLSDPQCMDALVLSRMDAAFPTATVVGGISLSASSIFTGQHQADQNQDQQSATYQHVLQTSSSNDDDDDDDGKQMAERSMVDWGTQANTKHDAWTAKSAVAAGLVLTSDR